MQANHTLARSLLLLALLLPGLALAANSDALRRQIEALGDTPGEARLGTHPNGLRNIEQIADLYDDNLYQPLWFDGGPLASQRADLIAEIEASAGHGFDLARYHHAALAGRTLPESQLELLFTDALLSQADDRVGGAIAKVDDEWYIERPQLDSAAFLQALVASETQLQPALQALWPVHREYWALVDKRAALLREPDEYSELIAAGPLLRLGDAGPRVEQLQDRLLSPGEYSAVFDQRLKLAVVEFQRAAGLEPDGIVGAGTLEVLNADRFSWIERIDANLERWRWLPRDIPATYIRVNIAAFRLRVIEDRERALGMDVIVGKPFRQTPIFAESLKYLVFYPYWNVPYSIAVKDKLPLLRNNPAPLALSGYEVQLRGSEAFLPVDQVDWSEIQPGQFTLRQQPGEKNALGRVKFMLPNTHAVYLHDTPDKALFSKTERIFSSGCIRLAEPRKLADWVLKYDNSQYLARVGELLASGPTTTAYLSRPIPVFMVYFTAFLEDGEVVFRRDVYERDQRIINQLRSGA